MKSVLISIKPYWFYLICERLKTIEIRKTFPKSVDWDRRTYLYCTKDMKSFNKIPYDKKGKYHKFFGKVGASFVCDEIYTIDCDSTGFFYKGKQGYIKKELEYNSCLSEGDIFSYLFPNVGYGWHISELKIYDEPKELIKFKKPCNFNYDCFLCDRAVYDKKVIADISGKIKRVDNRVIACNDVITRPPQLWCYVDELR